MSHSVPVFAVAVVLGAVASTVAFLAGRILAERIGLQARGPRSFSAAC